MASIASWQLRPGLNPYDRGSNRASHSGSSALRTRAWWHRSVITGIPSGRSFLVSPAFGMCTRLTARGCQQERVRCTRTASSARAWEVNATSPSMPAVLRPALRCVTCRTLTSVLDQLRSISFCRFLTLGQSPSCTALKILLRSRRTSCSCRCQSMESHPAAVSPGRKPSGPFAIGVQLVLWFRRLSLRRLQRLTCPRQHAFASGPACARYPASSAATTSGGAGQAVPASCRLSATGVGFLGILFSPRKFSSPCGRPTTPKSDGVDLDEVPMFRTCETRLGQGVLWTPGTAVSPRPSALLSRRLPPCNGRSLSPRHCLPTRDVRLTRHQQGFIVIHPSSLPLACGPRTEQGPSGFPLGFAPRRPEPAMHARAGTGLDTDPGYVFDITSNLLQRSHSPRATSCRRRRVLPSTARAWRHGCRWSRSASQAPIAVARASASRRLRVRRRVASAGTL